MLDLRWDVHQLLEHDNTDRRGITFHHGCQYFDGGNRISASSIMSCGYDPLVALTGREFQERDDPKGIILHLFEAHNNRLVAHSQVQDMSTSPRGRSRYSRSRERRVRECYGDRGKLGCLRRYFRINGTRTSTTWRPLAGTRSPQRGIAITRDQGKGRRYIRRSIPRSGRTPPSRSGGTDPTR